MLVHQAFRFELAPTAAQRAALINHAGAARWAWNWGLAVRRKTWQRRRQTLNAMDLHLLLNRLKRTTRYGWLYEVSKCAPQEALRDLDRAYANWWRSRKQGRRGGRPRFKKKGRCPERFRLTGAIHVERDAVVLPRIGRVRTKEATGKFRGGQILSATCRREADRWYVALTVNVVRLDPAAVTGPVVGVDRGIRTFAVCSDGTTIDSPRALARGQRRLRRRGRAVTRKQPGSANRRRAVLALARYHRRIRNQRVDALHKATTALAKAKSVIVVEDLYVAGMVRNRRLARAIADQGWGEFHRQLTYKTAWYGSRLLVAPRFYPSSKTCSSCGLLKTTLPQDIRMFSCEGCGQMIDRDLNAARNLARLAEAQARLVAASSAETRNACGEGSAGWAATGPVELTSVKQERTRVHTITGA
jgi:putative transposase